MRWQNILGWVVVVVPLLMATVVPAIEESFEMETYGEALALTALILFGAVIVLVLLFGWVWLGYYLVTY